MCLQQGRYAPDLQKQDGSVTRQTGPRNIIWRSPSGRDLYFAGQESEITCPYEIAWKFNITDNTSGPMTYPAQAIPSNKYYIFMETLNRVAFLSGNFTIAYQ
ncbi:hypothetical protein DFH94DRAFT_686345 [Russula ochroleuca]|uniref:Uncharacterized protein n=1 Tax=Russula ochroleuca TaxID=152965 RepID=A0A9P5JWI5_9AGAM|nr:hypothetical protein DFH94DRAFT_686345 [Russula ochroleuca]